MSFATMALFYSILQKPNHRTFKKIYVQWNKLFFPRCSLYFLKLSFSPLRRWNRRRRLVCWCPPLPS